MNDLYELKVSVEGLTQTLRDLNRLDATMEKLGGKTPGLDQFESRMAVAMRDMTQAANQMVIASSRMSSSAQSMLQGLGNQAKTIEKTLSGVTASAKKSIQMKWKDVDFSWYLETINRMNKGYKASAAEVQRLTKLTKKYAEAKKLVDANPETAAAFKDLAGGRALKYLQNNDFSRQATILKTQENAAKLDKAQKELNAQRLRDEKSLQDALAVMDKRDAERMQRAAARQKEAVRNYRAMQFDAKQGAAQAVAADKALASELKLTQAVGQRSLAYDKYLTKVQDDVRLKTGSLTALKGQVAQLKHIEAEYQRINALQGRERMMAQAGFKSRYGASAWGADASAARTTLLASAAGEVDRRFADANKKLIQTHNYSKKVHDVWRGIAAATGNLWLSWGNFVGMAAGLALGGSVFKSLTLGKDLGWQMELVGVAAETGRKNVNDLRDEVLALGSQGSLYGPVQLASALRILAQAGLKTKEALAVLPTTLNLSLVAEVDTERSALFLAGLRSAFSLADNEVAQAADQTAKAAAESQTSIEQMMESMKQASSEANKFGVSVSDTSTVLALLARVNITGSAAGTAMKNLLTDLAGRTDRSRKALEALGISAYNSSGMVKPFSQIVGELQERFAGMTDQQKQGWMRSFLNERGMRAANVLLNTTNEEFERLRKNIDRAGENMGYTNSQAQLLAKTTEGMFRGMKSSWESTFASNGVANEGQFQELISSMTSLANSSDLKSGLSLLTKGFLGVGQGLIGLAHAASVATPAILTLGAYLGGSYTVMLAKAASGALASGAATGLFTKAVLGLKAVLVSTPWGVALGTVAAVATAAYISWDSLQKKVADVRTELSAIPAAAGAVSNEVYEAFNTSGKGFDIDKRLGIGVSIDKLNQLSGAAEKISKEFELSQAKTAGDFQSNLTKILAVTADEAQKSSTRMKELSGEASTHELEQRVMVKDRTKSILTEQLTKFDQHYSSVKDLSKDAMDVRLHYEQELDRVTRELMTDRTALAVKQMQETAAEAIAQQGALNAFFGRVSNTFSGNGANNRSAMRVLGAARSGDTSGLSGTEVKALNELVSGASIGLQEAHAALAKVGGLVDTQATAARRNSYHNKTQVQSWMDLTNSDPQKSAVMSQRNLNQIQARMDQVNQELAVAVFEHRKVGLREELKNLTSDFEIEKSRLNLATELQSRQAKTARIRAASEVDYREENDPPTKADKTKAVRAPQDFSGTKAIDIQRQRLEQEFKFLQTQRENAISKSGAVPAELSARLVSVADSLDALSAAAETEKIRLERNKAEAYLKDKNTTAEGRQAASATLKALNAAFPGRVTSRFGTRTMGGKRGFHNGVDIAMPIGTRLNAPESGRVSSVWSNSRGGNQMQFVGDSGKTYGLAHLSQAVAKVGQRLEAGDLMAKSGNTGRSTGPHLHLTLTVNGKKVDPQKAKLGGIAGASSEAAYLGDVSAGSYERKGDAARKQMREDAYLSTVKEAEATKISLQQREHMLTVQETLGNLSQRERREQEHLLQVEKMKLETKLKVAELMAKGDDYQAGLMQEEGNRSVAQEVEKFQATQQAQQDWKTGIKTAYQVLVDDSVNYGTFAASAFDSVTGTMIGAMQQLAVTGKLNFREMTASILSDLAKIAMRMAMLKLIEGVGSMVGGGFTESGAAASSAWGSAAGGYTGLLASAKGNAFGPQGHLTAYAAGGVVSSPTPFRHAGGRGLMGENGAEGILPLSRMPNGDLGVQMMGASGGAMVNAPVNVSVVVNSDGSSETEMNEGLAKQLGENIKGMVLQFIQTELRPGGSINNAIRGT